MKQTRLAGERVVLRPWHDRDADAFAAMNADSRVMQFFVAPLSRAESDALLSRIRAVIEECGWGWWCVDIDGECAGFTGLSTPPYETPFTPCVEVGWRFRPLFWGRGYATEAAQLALDYGFRKLQLPEIVSFTAAGNLRSRRVMERIGMQRDFAGDFDHPRIPEGHALRRHVLYRTRRHRS
ncbi:MAG TPA: GNAT family N-acetyltransferase [Burkholderiaceae bacterium]|jgi:RimJ/RimL family protein N-acetyltransferase|nr:GNAT family N-acetyltransferase [Burkholderiaceae bacterium]